MNTGHSESHRHAKNWRQKKKCERRLGVAGIRAAEPWHSITVQARGKDIFFVFYSLLQFKHFPMQREKISRFISFLRLTVVLFRYMFMSTWEYIHIRTSA